MPICVKATPHGILVCIKDLCEELFNSVLSMYMCINYFCYDGKMLFAQSPKGYYGLLYSNAVLFL